MARREGQHGCPAFVASSFPPLVSLRLSPLLCLLQCFTSTSLALAAFRRRCLRSRALARGLQRAQARSPRFLLACSSLLVRVYAPICARTSARACYRAVLPAAAEPNKLMLSLEQEALAFLTDESLRNAGSASPRPPRLTRRLAEETAHEVLRVARRYTLRRAATARPWGELARSRKLRTFSAAHFKVALEPPPRVCVSVEGAQKRDVEQAFGGEDGRSSLSFSKVIVRLGVELLPSSGSAVTAKVHESCEARGIGQRRGSSRRTGKREEPASCEQKDVSSLLDVPAELSASPLA